MIPNAEGNHRFSEAIDWDGSLLIPAVGHLRGRCLDLVGASDEWVELLESTASHVTSIGNPDGLGRVYPAGYDTVVAASRMASLGEVAGTSRRMLRQNGSVLLAIDGWACHLRATDRSISSALRDLPRWNAWRIRRTLRSADFESITLYGVFPSISEPKFIYPLSQKPAVQWFIENRLRGWKKFAGRAAHAVDLFEQGQPGYLAICQPTTNDRTGLADISGPESAVTRISYNRVVTFELSSGRLIRVRKETRPGVADTTVWREQEILDALREESRTVPEAVRGALPAGSVVRPPTGALRLEEPVSGAPIGFQLDQNPVTVGRILHAAYDWLASFQRAYRGEPVVRTPDELRRKARYQELGVTDPPTVGTPVSSFVAPCHGDFHPWNVYADRDGLSMVIDWEYATLSGDPVVDPAHFLLYVCAHIGDDFEDGFDVLCASETDYSKAVRRALNHYCDRVGLSRRGVVAGLTYAHIHTLRTLRELGEPPAYPILCRTYTKRLDTINGNFDKAMDILG